MCICIMQLLYNSKYVGENQASLVSQTVKNPPAMRETWIRSLGWEDPLERAWQSLQYSCLEKPHGQRSLEGSWGCKESDTTEQLSPTQHSTGENQ